jgi:hypothetical protein
LGYVEEKQKPNLWLTLMPRPSWAVCLAPQFRCEKPRPAHTNPQIAWKFSPLNFEQLPFLNVAKDTELGREMPQSTDDVRTVVGNDLAGYIQKLKLEEFLQSLFGKKIKVYVRKTFKPLCKGRRICAAGCQK